MPPPTEIDRIRKETYDLKIMGKPKYRITSLQRLDDGGVQLTLKIAGRLGTRDFTVCDFNDVTPAAGN